MAHKQPERCAGTCGRLVRPYKTTPEKWPGTVRWHGSGMCKKCHVARQAPVSKPRFRPCEQCGVLTRPKGLGALDAPEDTRQRVGELCLTCHTASAIASPAAVAEMRAGLVTYLRWRGREVPAELLVAS